MLSYGVPREWIDEVRAATEATLFDVADHLPKEAAEALLDLAVGATPQLPAAIPAAADPFAHPDAQRRFRVIESVAELERALDAPWEKWTVFLHPAQRQLVEKSFGGPARVYGSAGTGKTIVALHRAVHLARTNREARVLLATFSPALANALRLRIRQLIGNEPRIGERLEVHSMSSIGHRLYEANFGKLTLATPARIREALAEGAAAVGAVAAVPAVGTRKFTPYFLWSEWTSVVDAWQLANWEEYRDVKRLGRKTRLPEAQRRTLWSIFEKAKASLAAEGLITEPAMFARLAEKLATLKRPVFDYAVIDEAQDIGIPELRFLAALGSWPDFSSPAPHLKSAATNTRPNALFFAGDLGQRIFQQPFSWSSLGVDVRGRSSRLRINYRTSHQIRKHADRLLADKLADVDGQNEHRTGTISVFNGVPPEIATEKDEAAEQARVVAWVNARLAEGLHPHELAIFVRSTAQLPRAEAVAKAVGAPYVVLDENVETRHGHLTIATMHLAKGLEFRAVAVMACDDEVIPLQERIEAVTGGTAGKGAGAP